ncbi:MAG: hemerythrin domain-containing protein [archaeon]
MKITKETSKILSKEHKNIIKVVSALESEIVHIKDKDIDKTFFNKTIDFIKNYADKFHHSKEEDILFKEFNKCAEEGCVHCNPVEQMLVEHDDGRRSIKKMEEGLSENNKDKIIEGARHYIELIREHIYKEDNILYPMADEAISDEVERKMLEKFKKINAERKKDVEKFELFAEEVKSEKLLNLARPYLEKNDLGVGHTERVLNISRKHFQRPDERDEFIDAIAILHDIGGASIKEQYEKGPGIARELMTKLQFSEKEIEEACEIIKTHHNQIKNPTEEFAILYDSDQLVKLTPEEYFLHEKEGINWKNLINSLHHQTAKDLAKEWLLERGENEF